MKFLLDTNALLYWLAGSPRINHSLKKQLTNPRNEVFVSAVSTFEIAVKARLGRLTLSQSPGLLLPRFFAEAGLTALPITLEHGLAVYDLPKHHADPFDRMLIAQAIVEDLTIVSSDRAFGAYPIRLDFIQ